MELKNALSVCLIALFSATLVVLIARALDLQVAARLEPQLDRIATQLEALRAAGGLATAPSASPPAAALRDGLMVYYFHGNKRCPTCRAIEAQSFETVQTDFAAQLDGGTLAWQTLNYDESAGKDLAQTFEVDAAVVVLAQMKDGQMANWKRLDEVWGLVGDEAAFAQFIRDEVNQMLPPSTPESTTSAQDDAGVIPMPDEGNDDLPLPTDPARVPVPE